ncbi:MAG: excinuclease ABC subunit UvrA, partial [Bdellovibrionales bacterium]|nr:excinuclease ABC subunit UvrA [Bdellovibrionales bacterium]
RELVIKGAREHNLQNIELSVPLNKIVCLTGVSGSGKSTIAKDIIYAEGQRRYLDCLSPYARQFIKELKKPEIDAISNVRPTVCVYQHTFQPGRLSTVGTMSEVYNFLRLLYAKTATQYCPQHSDQQIRSLSSEQMAEEIRSLNENSIKVLAPVIKNKKGNHRAVLERAIASEIDEVRVDGAFGRPGSFLGELQRGKLHSIDYCVARFAPNRLDIELIKDCIDQALALGGGSITVVCHKREINFSLDRACPTCKVGFFKPDPEDLSFNSKRGACPKCSGTGYDERGELCERCDGTRISELGRHLRLFSTKHGSLNIAETSWLTAPELIEFLSSLSLEVRQELVAAPILRELHSRIEILNSFGLDYLELDRDCSSLSNGELQRLRLASAMGSPLSGVMYIFDEPSAGLHPLDNLKITDHFHCLKEQGNSVVIIEHDPQTIRSAEHIIDVGPGGGSQGGKITFSGGLKDFLSKSKTVTAQALLTESLVESGTKRPARKNTGQLELKQVSCNNIVNLNVKLPLNQLVCVAGVSGAGKSSLVHGIVYEVLSSGSESKQHWHLDGMEIESNIAIERALFIDQKPLGKNSRSTPSSYLGIFDDIRKLFASSIEAKARGFDASYFSYNTGRGRCPTCKGLGAIKLEMSFLAEASVECELCHGKRYSDEADSILYLGMSISSVLGLTFEQAKVTFSNHRKIHQILHQACELGLGYLTLGQASGTLSGGESQRIKLVAELSGNRKGHTLYLLDEPTTGLHRADVGKLLRVLHQLVELGHSVLVIEHDKDFIVNADHIIELGPGPSDKGGKVIYSGTPEKLAGKNTPWGDLLQN